MIDNAQWDKELEELINKAPIPCKPEIPEVLQFPFLIVFYRKKVSLRNQNYLIAVPIFTIADYAISVRTLKHKGWPISAAMFDIPNNMRNDNTLNRYRYYKYHDWIGLSRIITSEERQIIPALQELFPCNIVQIKEKDGQFKLIM